MTATTAALAEEDCNRVCNCSRTSRGERQKTCLGIQIAVVIFRASKHFCSKCFAARYADLGRSAPLGRRVLGPCLCFLAVFLFGLYQVFHYLTTFTERVAEVFL
jgi:hypothetical protein